MSMVALTTKAEREKWDAECSDFGIAGVMINRLVANVDELEAKLAAAEKRAELRDKLLACYRTGKRPSEKLLDELALEKANG